MLKIHVAQWLGMTSDSLHAKAHDAVDTSQPSTRNAQPALVQFDAIGDATADDIPAAEPKTADGFFQRGLKSAQLGFPDRAAADFEEAAWMEPDNATIQFNLGTAFLSMGMFEQALVNFDRTLALQPDMSDALGNRAVAHTALGQDDRAAADIARAIELGAPPDGIHAVIEYVKARRQTTST